MHMIWYMLTVSLLISQGKADQLSPHLMTAAQATMSCKHPHIFQAGITKEISLKRK